MCFRKKNVESRVREKGRRKHRKEKHVKGPNTHHARALQLEPRLTHQMHIRATEYIACPLFWFQEPGSYRTAN